MPRASRSPQTGFRRLCQGSYSMRSPVLQLGKRQSFGRLNTIPNTSWLTFYVGARYVSTAHRNYSICYYDASRCIESTIRTVNQLSKINSKRKEHIRARKFSMNHKAFHVPDEGVTPIALIKFAKPLQRPWQDQHWSLVEP